MEVKDIQPNQGNIDVVLVVTDKGDTRTFEKFGNTGSVCNAQVKDDSGEIKMTLWNEDIDKVKVGDKIHLKNGWCSEYQGERQLSSGKFGTIEVLENQAETPKTDEPVEVMTNEPSMLAPGGTEDTEPVQEEESVE
ncbi:DNA-binding protein [Candidatus Woesearchaeota archaeon]|nr:DNA-binding protein [Candidatus Woesearchaeota archaeon]